MAKLIIILMTLIIALATFIVVISDYIYAKLFATGIIILVSFMLGTEFYEEWYYCYEDDANNDDDYEEELEKLGKNNKLNIEEKVKGV